MGMTTDITTGRGLEPLMNIEELAEYLGVPVQTLYDLRAQGRGPRGFRVGRCLHFRKSEVEAWLAGLEEEDHSQGAPRIRP